jgi:hypothetical protein
LDEGHEGLDRLEEDLVGLHEDQALEALVDNQEHLVVDILMDHQEDVDQDLDTQDKQLLQV